MNYQEAFELAQGNSLSGRIQEAMHEWVLSLPELAADAPLRAEKVAFALQIINSRTTWAERLGWFVAASIRKGQIPADSTDEQLQAVVNGLSESRPSSVTSLHPYGAALVSTNSAVPSFVRE